MSKWEDELVATMTAMNEHCAYAIDLINEQMIEARRKEAKREQKLEEAMAEIESFAPPKKDKV